MIRILMICTMLGAGTAAVGAVSAQPARTDSLKQRMGKPAHPDNPGREGFRPGRGSAGPEYPPMFAGHDTRRGPGERGGMPPAPGPEGRRPFPHGPLALLPALALWCLAVRLLAAAIVFKDMRKNGRMRGWWLALVLAGGIPALIAYGVFRLPPEAPSS